MCIFKAPSFRQVLPFILPLAKWMHLFPYTQDSVKFYIHFCLFLFGGVFKELSEPRVSANPACLAIPG